MGKNIVILLDGTSNQISRDRTNVLRLYQTLEKSSRQLVYYNPGVGTFGGDSSWFKLLGKAREVWGLATGWGLDRNVKEAYRFLVENYSAGDPANEEAEDKLGDCLMIFGFSRGAYTARVLAGFLHAIGLIEQRNLNLLDYAYRAYKGIDERSDRDGNAFAEVRLFERLLDTRRPPIRLLGLFDTVSSVIESGRIGIRLKSHAFTSRNLSVESILHAVAIDEKRTMFQPQLWPDGQEYWGNPFNKTAARPQDVREVWFAGAHGDVGGGYSEQESGLAKVPLAWMIREAQKRQVLFRTQNVNTVALGRPRSGGEDYIEPDPLAPDHKTMTLGWSLVEFVPRRKPSRSTRPSLFGWTVPLFERRVIPDASRVHDSVVERKKKIGRWPKNIPRTFTTEK